MKVQTAVHLKMKTVFRIVFSICIAALFSSVAAAQNPLVYVTFLTGLTSGGTNVYEIDNSGPQLLATLNKGGGGPVAVHAQQNVYVIQADLDGGLYQVDSTVYRFAPGSKQGTPLFTALQLGAEAMTVAADGTVYIAGRVPETGTFSVVKFTPPSYAPQVLNTADDPRYPTGISVDTAGSLFVGYLDSFRSRPIDTCASGCIYELPAGRSKWILRLPDLAADGMGAGPFVTTDGSLIFWTGSSGRFNYIETVAAQHNYPRTVLRMSPDLVSPGNMALALNAGGSELWTTSTGFSGILGSNVYGIDYPAGNVSVAFPVDSPANLIFITGLAVSPAYFP